MSARERLPSDRLYFNRWVQLWSEGQLKEQVHYQCVWYGGALLADIGFEEPDPAESNACEALVTALKVNRHAVVLMDSDCREKQDSLKERVERVCAELNGTGGVAWVTAGREVENYIPITALREGMGKPELPDPGQYGDVFEHLPSYKKRKPELAHRIISTLTKELIAATYDLGEQLTKVCNQIRAWNGQREQVVVTD